MNAILFAFAALADPWQQPPSAILDVLNAPELPSTDVSPDGRWLLVTTPVRYPPIVDRAAPFFRLAGARVDPRTGGFHTPSYAVSPHLLNVRDGQDVPISLPADVHILDTTWSADGAYIAVSGLQGEHLGLWTVDLKGAAVVAAGLTLAPILGSEVQWLADQRHLLVKRADGRGPMPTAPLAPSGPEVRTSEGEKPSSTYEARDLLTSPYDEALFTYYATSQLAVVDVVSGQVANVGAPGLYGAVAASPDGRYARVERLVPPWSYRVTADRFARDVEVWTIDGATSRTIASLPVADEVPIHGVPVGPRDFGWDNTKDATLVWTEALDGGDPKAKVEFRDRLVRLQAPFDGAPTEWMTAPHRVQSVAFLAKGGAIVEMDEWERRWRHDWIVDAKGARPWFDGSWNDRYADPGRLVWDHRPDGRWVVAQDGDVVYFSGSGGTPDGDRPFVDRRSLTTGIAERVFRSGNDVYETFLGFTDPKRKSFLVRRQSESLVPNVYEVTLGARSKTPAAGEAAFARTDRQVTTFTDPTPALRGITKKIVSYTRADGVPLSFTLYLPAGYTPGTRLPTVLYAYPREFSDPATAGQIAGSAHLFDRFTGASHLFFLLQGYAVLNNTTMPVLGDPETAYDTFVDQLVADATAAIDKAVELGVTDRERIGVMGHSHGALMTATLLAHSDLFRAGIARSGAYNHTIRPFGFQSERRTLWEAKETYLAMSPVLFAPDIHAPLLLIHGAADENPGTIPFQSDRLFESIRGSGGTARLVLLPAEGHAYLARESVEQVLWEQVTWFDRYVKDAPAR